MEQSGAYQIWFILWEIIWVILVLAILAWAIWLLIRIIKKIIWLFKKWETNQLPKNPSES